MAPSEALGFGVVLSIFSVMLMGLAAVGWLAYSLIKSVTHRSGKTKPPARA